MALAASARISGSAWRSDGSDVGDQRRPLETAERAHRDAHRLRVAAVQPRADDRQIARRRRAAIFGLQHRQPRRARRRAARPARCTTTTEKTAERAKSAEKYLCSLRSLRCSAVLFRVVSVAGAASPPSTRASGPSGRADRRSSTSVISPDALVHGLERRHHEAGVGRQLQLIDARDDFVAQRRIEMHAVGVRTARARPRSRPSALMRWTSASSRPTPSRNACGSVIT